jgi:hypothetical protein
MGSSRDRAGPAPSGARLPTRPRAFDPVPESLARKRAKLGERFPRPPMPLAGG